MNEDTDKLFYELAAIIEQGKQKLTNVINNTVVIVYWHIGQRINREVLNNERAAYGKQIVSTLSNQLANKYGNSFKEKNVRRMMQFAEIYPDFEIVVSLTRQLSWTHLVNILPVKKAVAREYYMNMARDEKWSTRHTRKQIQLKAYERREIANAQLPADQKDLQYTFKDPYFLDFIGLKDGYVENDLEAALIKEMELFILELGKGFTFVERQKRIILDGRDFYLDLLFYHRKLKRLVAIELKIGRFEPAHKGQMELYLKWLNRYEKMEGENQPIGLILCTEASSEQIELMEVHKDGIMVAEYWTELPPKKQLEQKIQMALKEARERIERKKLLE